MKESILEEIYEVSRAFIQRDFPQEAEIYDIVWRSVSELFADWDLNQPEKWPVGEETGSTAWGLELVDLHSLNILTPHIIFLVTAILSKLPERRESLENGDFRAVVIRDLQKYGNKFKSLSI